VWSPVGFSEIEDLSLPWTKRFSPIVNVYQAFHRSEPLTMNKTFTRKANLNVARGTVSQDPEKVFDSLDQADRLLQAYLESTSGDLAELDRSLARGDLKVASMAHRLKRSAAEAGAHDLSEAASRIEACYRKGAFEILPFQVDAFCRAQARYSIHDIARR
jgi:HPt (histidine-containing phosphotransfer) domain-containing protein